MTKTRFSTSDVQAMVRDIRSSVMGHRVANVYDLNDKTYLFKFNVVSGVEGNSKAMLLMESGIRFHTTKFAREKNDMPSPFSMKLRKYIRTKRLEDVHQLSGDRVVDFKFGTGESCNHIILEMYANGNIVLTDCNYEVLALLRSHQFDADVSLKVGEIYPISFSTTEATTSSDICGGPMWSSLETFQRWALEKVEQASSGSSTTTAEMSTKKSKVRKMTYRQLLLHRESSVAFLGGEIVDHCLLLAGVNPSGKVEAVMDEMTVEKVNNLKNQLHRAPALLETLNTPGQPGFILTSSTAGNRSSNISDQSVTANPAPTVNFLEFVPLRLRQHQDQEFIEFSSFDDAVDEYFCKIEEQKLSKAATSAEDAAKKKIDKVRGEQESLIRGLSQQQEKMHRAALLVEAHAAEVDKVFLVLNSALGSGMSWDDIEEMVKNEKSGGNPIASLIARLRLDRNHVILQLENVFEEEEEEVEEAGEVTNETHSDNTSKHILSGLNDPKDVDNSSSDDEFDPSMLGLPSSSKQNNKSALSKPKKRNLIEVEVDLALSAHANARHLFDHKKVARAKEARTVEASEKAIAAVEEAATKALNAQNLARKLKSLRKMHWFEKFNWFITSEGYLVLSGRDAQQNEILVKRYLRAGDAYVHADLSGAASCIVRCKIQPGMDGPSHPISPLALQEAGCMSVCRSVAWSNKVVTSAWWVHANQVSKSAPTGEFLTTGSFMIYGKKNFLPPSSLEMGFGVLFRLADGSISRHLGDRKDRAVSGMDDMESVYSEAFDRYGIEFDGLTTDDGAASSSAVGHDVAPLETVPELEETVETDEDKEEPEHFPTGSDHEEDNLEEDPEHVEKEEVTEVEANLENHKKRNDVENKQKKSTAENANKKGGKGKSNEPKNAKIQHKVSVSDSPEVTTTNKKKFLNKKKARRYADQDDEDRELAMQALGHLKPGEKKGDKEVSRKQQEKQLQRVEKQEKLGINFERTDWQTSLDLLPPAPRAVIDELVANGQLRPGDIDSFELKSLSMLPESDSVAVLELFREGENLTKIGNKSGFLAGIMRRFQRDQLAQSNPPSQGTNPAESSAAASAMSRRDRKKQEQQEIQSILQEEGALDEEEGRQADELEKLTACPVSEDQLLYAVPMCGPYASMQGFKYRVKLTPGTGKKGKICKQAIELFSGGREVSVAEKTLMRAMTDPEMVAIMLNEVKMSMPGLFQAKQQLKQQSQNKKKKSNATRGSKAK